MKINTFFPDQHSFFQSMADIVLMHKKLYYIGSLPEIRSPVVAIVGTRKPSAYGKEVTCELAYALAKRGVTIVSGLAFGVDAIAHQAALEANGRTIAVLANGLHTVYPAAHRQLADRIIESGGVVISEYPAGTPARPFQFLARNRIISGLADAVIVTEAAARSGTLSTVAHALEQNKEVFAVPGTITSPLSVGSNRLIAQGAHPCLEADDVLRVIAPDLLQPQTRLHLTQGDSYSTQEQTVLTLIQSGIRNGDDLLAGSGLGTSEYLMALSMLEINGLIRPLGGNQWVTI